MGKSRVTKKTQKGGDLEKLFDNHEIAKNLVRNPNGELIFEGTVPENSKFSNVVFRKVHFKRVSFTRANFRGSQFEECRFDQVSFHQCNMTKAAFLSLSEPSPAHHGMLRHGGVGLYAVKFTGCKTVDMFFYKVECERVEFDTCDLQDVTFDSCDLLYSSFIDSNITQCIFLDSVCNHVYFSMNIMATQSSMTGSMFYNSHFVEAYFGRANLRDSEFSNSTISESHFMGANLSHVRFDRVQFSHVDFGHGPDRAMMDETTRFSETVFTNIQHDSDVLRRMHVRDMGREVIDEEEMIPPQGIAYEIHNASKKFDMDAFLHIIAPGKPVANRMRVSKTDFVKKVWSTLLSTYPAESRPADLMDHANAVSNRLIMSDKFDSNEVRDCVHKIVEFVHKQPAEFVVAYVDTFLEDCVHAYPLRPNVPPEEQDRMSCVQGIVERFYMSLGSVLFMFCNEESCPNPVYQELIRLFTVKIDNNALLQKWYQQTQTEGGDTKDVYERMSEQARYDDFVDFMKKEYQKVFHVDVLGLAQLQEIKDFADSQPWVRTLVLGGRRRLGGRRERRGKRVTRVTRKRA